LNIGKYGGKASGAIEKYDKTTRKIGYGEIEGEVSKKDYRKGEGSIDIKSNNGVTTARAGASYAKGTEYKGTLGEMEFTGGKEDKTSGSARITKTKNGVTGNAQIQDSHRLSWNAQLGDNFKAEVSAGKTQKANGQATFGKNGASVKANYETSYDAQAHITAGNTDVKARGKASENTYGNASVQFKNGQLNAQGKVGKEVSVGAGLTVDGKNVASIDASAKGEASAKAKADKNGVSAQAGINGQAGAQATFGQTEVKVSVKADFHIGFSFDFKTGLHFDIGGGIHAEVAIKDKKTGKETDIKLGMSQGKPAYILYRKRKIVKKNMKKSQKNKILGQACRPSRHRS